MTKHIAWVAVTVAVLGCAHAGIIAQEVPLERLTLPQGFRIDVYASGVENARQMTLSPTSAARCSSERDRPATSMPWSTITMIKGLTGS